LKYPNLNVTDVEIEEEEKHIKEKFLSELPQMYKNHSGRLTYSIGRHRVRREGKESKYKGVKKGSTGKNWRVRITYRSKTIHLGTFTNEKEAAAVYDSAVKKIYGNMAVTNQSLYPEDF